MELSAKKKSKRHEENRVYRAVNKARLKETRHVWYLKNKKKLLERGRKYRAENTETCKAYRKRNKVRIQKASRIWKLSMYGLTEKDFQSLLLKQGSRCAICAVELKSPRIDHNHETGEVRGLLCLRCNTGLGCFKDDAQFLDRASRYVRLRRYGTITKKRKKGDKDEDDKTTREGEATLESGDTDNPANPSSAGC